MTLQEWESQALRDGQDYTRRLLQERLQREAERIGPVSPRSGLKLRRARRVPLTLMTVCGEVKLSVWYGYDRQGNQWTSPAREHWRLPDYGRMSPELESRLCYTAVETGSFEKAARMARTWGTPVSDDGIHACVHRHGERARETPPPPPPLLPDEAKDAMVIMMDGWMARHRGQQWGLKPADMPAERIHWHEIKSAIVFRIGKRASTQSGRRVLIRKHVVASPAGTDPVDFGRHVYREALRQGMLHACHVYVIMDGAVWLWNVFEDRFSKVATGLLDFYHASEHLWDLAHHLYPDEKSRAQSWCVRLLHQLRHGKQAQVLGTLADLLNQAPGDPPQSQESIASTCAYFEAHAQHLDYAQQAASGVPIGSGAMESQCSQFQNRLKRRGQFWTRAGCACMLEITVRVQNEELRSFWAA